MGAPRNIFALAGTLAGLLALSVVLLLPSFAGAAPVTFGSPLTAGPTSFGCETEPVLLGDWTAQASNKPDCTWWQTGVFGVANDPRFGAAPATGNITRVDIIGGTNPVPVRIAVMRQLGTPGAGSDCCFFVSESAPLQPAPNQVSSFVVNIPVAHASVVGGIRADDYVGISAPNQAGGTAPFRTVGSTTQNAFFQAGSVNAAFLYPRFGSLAGDSGGGRREQGFPGVEVLARWTLCPAGDASCQPTVAPPPQATVAPAVANLARIQAGSALIRLVCKGNIACEGQLELLNQGALARSSKKLTSFGKKSYKISAGKKKTIKVKLNKKGKRLLKGRKKAKVALRITPKGGSASTTRITLKKK
jgi:hypothetical protein